MLLWDAIMDALVDGLGNHEGWAGGSMTSFMKFGTSLFSGVALDSLVY